MQITQITSKDNEKIKFLKKLSQKKYREESGKFLIENLTIIYDAVKAGYQPESLFVTQELINKNTDKFNLILEKSGLAEYFVIDEKINKVFSSLETVPGICGVFVHPKNEIKFDEKIIYLNAINDPGNLGTILRSAVAFDLKNIVVDETCVDVYNPKTISAAKDSIFKLQIVYDKNLEVLKKIKNNMSVLVTRLEGGEEIENLKQEKFCLVLGNETHGVSQEIQDMADKFIKIKMSTEIESLNVAVSAAILFQYIYNKK